MPQKHIAVYIIIIGMVIFLLSPPITSHAQEPTPENDTNCVVCHEHRYYLYDRGKWYCLCDAPMHCVYCHGGRTDSPIEKIAHEGLVLYPTRNQAERCQTCHTEDYMSRVVTFETVAGVSSTPIPIITATPMTVASTLAENPPSNPLILVLSQLEPWRKVVLGLLMVTLTGIMIYSYRCWRADCLKKNKTIYTL